MARETRSLPGRRQRGLGVAKAGGGKSVGTVSHRPFPGLPDEEGMARETRALPGRRQRGLGVAKAGSGKSVGPRALTVRSLGCRVRRGWPERLEPYRGEAAGPGGLMDQKRAALVFLVTGEHSGPLRGSDL